MQLAQLPMRNLTGLEYQALHQPAIQRALMAYKEFYFRYLWACTQFPKIAHSIEEPDFRDFIPSGVGKRALEPFKAKWRAEFSRRA